MFNQGDKVIVAVSGGPDSICLLHILYILKEKLNISLAVAHLNHCLRGEEADKDEKYVKEFCRVLNVECFIKRVDIHKLSKKKSISCEMAGREARYNFFQEVLKEIDGHKIAIAHNANDQAETVFMRIIRGTGIEGLVGIKAVRDDVFIRPIIDITRKEIEEYCEKNKLHARIDKTNLENIFTRNKIRLELIPYIEKNFNPDIIKVINRLADTVKTDNNYLNKIANNNFRKYCKINKDKVIIYKEVFNEEEAILSRVIRLALKELKGNLYNFEKTHVYDIIEVQKKSTGKVVMLTNNINALNSYGDIHLYIKTQKTSSDNVEHLLKLESENNIEEMGVKINFKLVNNLIQRDLKNDNLIKYFDYDKINGAIKIRFRKNGDRFTPFGMRGSKKLKDLFMDLKIPKNERDVVPLVCFSDEIAWVVGYRISDKFKVDKDTKNILQIKIESEE
nr:tRNA lysidine(34) synthetase TilS [Clostridium aestuarii]